MKPYDTEQDKKEQVREMFDRIAPAYDRLNHTLSFQIDKLWRRHVVRIVRRMQPRRILDVATGTGDLALAMARRMRGVQVLGVDLSENMLAEARRKATACGLDERALQSLNPASRIIAIKHSGAGNSSTEAGRYSYALRSLEIIPPIAGNRRWL